MAYVLTRSVEERLTALWKKLPEPRPTLADVGEAVMSHAPQTALDAAEKLSVSELAALVAAGPRKKGTQ